MIRFQRTRTSTVMTVALFATMMLASPVQAVDLEERGCDKEDNSGGWGGQHLDCSFACEDGDTLTVDVEAADEDADVKGRVTCANAEAECGWTSRQCDAASSTPTTYASSNGKCEGDSEETFDSGLSLRCTSGPAGCAHNPSSCDPGECDILETPKTCILKLLDGPIFSEGLVQGDLPLRAVEDLAEAYAEAGTWTSRAFIWGTESGPIGASCTAQGCVILRPLCVTDDLAVTRCSVSMGAAAVRAVADP